MDAWKSDAVLPCVIQLVRTQIESCDFGSGIPLRQQFGDPAEAAAQLQHAVDGQSSFAEYAVQEIFLDLVVLCGQWFVSILATALTHVGVGVEGVRHGDPS